MECLEKAGVRGVLLRLVVLHRRRVIFGTAAGQRIVLVVKTRRIRREGHGAHLRTDNLLVATFGLLLFDIGVNILVVEEVTFLKYFKLYHVVLGKTTS